MSTVINQYTEERSQLGLVDELHRLFGHRAFLGRQEDVIAQVMRGIDTVAVMPTGAGKSLCYQLPAMLLPGTTLVISPLIALMKDQYDSLPADVYNRTTFINSTLDMDSVTQRVGEIIRGKYKLVYCAPERLRQQPFVEALRRAQISLLVVDEAHCVSMWGHDFRPDYLFIGKCLPLLGHPTVLALTATATPQIRAEIAAQLGRDLKPVVASVFRPNLYYEVEELADKEQKWRRLLEICKAEKGPGVVYARSRETCEQLAAMLRRSGVQAAHYHAGMDPEDRARTQEMFMLDRVRVIVATIAFGMGIDKANVRLIVHFSPPDTLEGYVQESGRAGRDGRPARCVLFISAGDQRNLVRWKRQEQIKVEELRAVYRELAKQVPAGQTRIVNLDELVRPVSEAAGKEVDGTGVRVAVSLLERVRLFVRHPDAPRTATLALTERGEQATDPNFARFREAAGLETDQSIKRDMAYLSSMLGASPVELERAMLGWMERGWISYRGDKRDAVIERLRPPSDVAEVINRLLEQQDQAQQRQIAQMIDYATENRCRHQMLAAHLGEEIDECVASCDYCSPPLDRPVPVAADVPDLPENPGQVIIECLASFPFSVGKPSLVKALVGSAASNLKADRVLHFGALAGASPSSIDKAITELADTGYLDFYEQDGFRLLAVTNEGREDVPRSAVTLKSKRLPKKGLREKAKEAKEERDRAPRGGPSRSRGAVTAPEEERPPTPEEADLFERLRAWRRVTANRQNLPPYIIFHDKTLWAIARARPQTEGELMAIKGVGTNQAQKYGPDLFELIGQE